MGRLQLEADQPLFLLPKQARPLIYGGFIVPLEHVSKAKSSAEKKTLVTKQTQKETACLFCIFFRLMREAKDDDHPNDEWEPVSQKSRFLQF